MVIGFGPLLATCMHIHSSGSTPRNIFVFRRKMDERTLLIRMENESISGVLYTVYAILCFIVFLPRPQPMT